MNENIRLQMVREFNQLQLTTKRELIQTVAYAAKRCHVLIAAITLLEKDTQWIKAAQGLDTAQLPRDLSFCTQVIKRNRLLVIQDMQLDKRYAAHPYVVSGHLLRFYAGFPLTTHGRYRIGSLCILDHKPHKLTKEQQFLFKLLAKHAMSVMEVRLGLDQLEYRKSAMKQLRQNKSANEIKLRSMFESLTDPYYLLGKNGEILDFNHAAYAFVQDNCLKQLSYGYVMSNCLTRSYQPVFMLYYRKALQGKREHLERQSGDGPDNQDWWEYVFEQVRNDAGEIIGVSYVTRNISERKRNEQKIVAQNQVLSRIAEIQSHDYRGPLATILWV